MRRMEGCFVMSAEPTPTTRPPPGWKLVPLKPTQAMLDAMEFPSGYRFEVAETYGSIGIPTEKCADIYEAMLDAAPEPPV